MLKVLVTFSSFSLFEFKNHGNIKYYKSSQGKMEKSFLRSSMIHVNNTNCGWVLLEVCAVTTDRSNMHTQEKKKEGGSSYSFVKHLVIKRLEVLKKFKDSDYGKSPVVYESNLPPRSKSFKRGYPLWEPNIDGRKFISTLKQF